MCPSLTNNEMYLHHCFLAPWGYLCSTSLKTDQPHPQDHPLTPPPPITDKPLGPVMTTPCSKLYGNGSSRRALTDRQTHTNGRTDERYQEHYLPRFAVDKKFPSLTWTSKYIKVLHRLGPASISKFYT